MSGEHDTGTCNTCYWWNRSEAKSVLIAECRGGPPSFADSMVDPRAWPHTRREDWCGKWKQFSDVDDSDIAWAKRVIAAEKRKRKR